jgi:hypothetical protein
VSGALENTLGALLVMRGSCEASRGGYALGRMVYDIIDKSYRTTVDAGSWTSRRATRELRDCDRMGYGLAQA